MSVDVRKIHGQLLIAVRQLSFEVRNKAILHQINPVSYCACWHFCAMFLAIELVKGGLSGFLYFTLLPQIAITLDTLAIFAVVALLGVPALLERSF